MPSDKSRIAIIGYGNVGRGTEYAVRQAVDMILQGVYTRRDPYDIRTLSDAPVFNVDNFNPVDVDVAILCGGSATDLPKQGPEFASLVNTVDSFDTHKKIPDYFDLIDNAAKEAGNTCVISTGWDPGLFSIMRLIEDSSLPNGMTYTFWGKE